MTVCRSLTYVWDISRQVSSTQSGFQHYCISRES